MKLCDCFKATRLNSNSFSQAGIGTTHKKDRKRAFPAGDRLSFGMGLYFSIPSSTPDAVARASVIRDVS